MRTRVLAVVAVCLSALPVASAVAQPVADVSAPSGVDQLRAVVRPGDAVIVTDVRGQTAHGRVGEITASSLALLAGGRRIAIALGDIETVARRDSRWNGTLLGAGAAAVLGALVDRALVKEYGREDISVGASAGFVVGAAAFGAGVGFAIDAMVRRTQVLYSRTPPSTGGGASLSPIWSNGRRGVALSIPIAAHRR